MAGEKILVVDDDPGLLMLMRVRLEAAGYQVISAEGGQEALIHAQAEACDLALVDLKALPRRAASGATIVVTVVLSLLLAALLWLPRLFPVPGGDRVAVAAVALSLGVTSWALAHRTLRAATQRRSPRSQS